MIEEIEKTLNYLEDGEDFDTCYRVSLIREYIKELNSKIEKMQPRIDYLEKIYLNLFIKEFFNDEKI